MRSIDASDAQEQFDALLTTLEAEGPVAIKSRGKEAGVLLPPGLLETLLADVPEGVNPRVAALSKQSIVKRWKVFAALRRYEHDNPDM